MRRRRRRRVLLVGGLVAFGAYKLSTRDAKRVEEHTGIPPEEMTDAELEQAMNDLDIEHQTRDANDVEAGTEASNQTAASPADELAKFAELNDQGVLTDAEFEAQKKRILGL